METCTKDRLLAVNFHLYKPCNERCRYCFATFPEVRGQLTADDAERLVRQLAEAGTKKLTFVGGEPTLHPALPRLLRVAHSAKVTTAIVSNGAKLRAALEAAPGAVDWVGLSVDSADEEVQKQLGRGAGRYVRDSISLFDYVRQRGIRTKLNTVVTRLNWEEDLSALVRRVSPERWKVFQVLAVNGQNDGSVEPLLITAAQFRSFVDRHAALAAEGLAPVPEDNDAMTGSYLMVDPLGRFFDNVAGRLRFSRPILEIGIERALREVQFELARLQVRGGVYAW
ncbi:MAG TPA: viperin family antiviral radical SAM protein [Myxococcales bacterium]|jgi:radical S-adenosyl methionine domain-containing protein 2